MSALTSSPRITLDHREAAAVRALLRDRGYTEQGVAALGAGAFDADDVVRLPGLTALLHAEDLVESGDPASIAFALLSLGAEVPESAYEPLDAELRTTLEALGWVTGDGVRRSTVAVTCLQDRLLLSDRMIQLDDGVVSVVPNAGTRVMPPSTSTLDLWDTAAGEVRGRYLDIGCGCGVHAILSEPRTTRRLGVDVLPRAIAFARLNGLLNEVEADFAHVDARTILAREPIDFLTFNAPWGPVADDPVAGNRTSTAMLADHLRATILPVLADGATALLYCVLELTAEHATPQAVASSLLGGVTGFHCDVTPLPDSGFRLSRDDLARGHVPTGSALLRRPSDRDRLIASFARTGIVEVSPSLIRISR